MNNMRNKILSLLVLLVAATGAWADEVVIGEGTGTTYYFPIDDYFNFSCTEEIYTADEIGTEGTINAISFYYNYDTPYVASNVKMFMKHVTRSAFGANTDCEPLSETDLVWTGSIAPTEAGWFTFTLDTPFEYNGTDNLLVAFFDGTSGYPGRSYTWRQTPSPNEANMALRYYSDNIAPDPYNLSNYSGSKALYQYRGNIKLDIEESVDVTTNAEEGETVFTEAWFDMPAYDATVNYETLRDMSVQMTAQMGDGTQEQPRYRVQKKQQGDGYEPADLQMDQVMALLSVTDGIENKTLTPQTDFYCLIYALDEQGQPTGNGVELQDFDFAPGLYALTAVGQDDSYYDGETALSNIFELYQGYEVTVPAGEFVTYYKDEALTLYDDEAQLYTITAVSETTATATPFDVIPANVPLLLKNNSSQTRTILLIPTEDPLAFMPYSGFVGSLDPTTIAASTDTQTNYACNGKAFVYVKDAIDAGANKAWLSIPSQQTPGARQLKIVFADATTSIHNSQFTIDNGDWFDLNGRKLDKMPTKKGVYIQNGKKVVVK